VERICSIGKKFRNLVPFYGIRKTEGEMKLITGASRGIGWYLLDRFRTRGDLAYGTFLKTRPPEKWFASFSEVDVSNFLDVSEWISKAAKIDDRIELINCAAINYDSFAHKADPKKWARVIETNLIGTFNAISAALPFMRKFGYGRIINFSSIVDRLGVPGTSAYAASKAGLLGLTKVLAAENASKGITINNLSLGYFKIGMGCSLSTELSERIKARIPVNEFGDPETIYNAVNFLINNSYVNGASLDINGGLQ
jgi:NAD(P)-dependent dehydrogenase (short-subunit alcohol dehydrogenase family)